MIEPEDVSARSGNGEMRPPQFRRPLRMLFYVVSGLMLAFVVGGFFMPREIRTVRTLEIPAPRDAVYRQLESFGKWDSWAPWFIRNVFLEKKLEGPQSGPGSVLTWNSKEDGAGRIKVVSAVPLQKINMAVDFGSEGDGITWFELNDAGNGRTAVSWGFAADAGHNYARRYFGFFFRMSVNRDFDEGLANLKSLFEQGRAN